MASLVRHFGDVADGQSACGICDFCAPAECVAQRFRPATARERAMLFRVLKELRPGDRRSTGKLHSTLCPSDGMNRNDFEAVLGAMARSGMAELNEAVFEKEGKQIPYRTVRLTPQGRDVEEDTAFDFLMKDATLDDPGARPRKRKGKAAVVINGAAEAPAADARLEGVLRNWRLQEAKKRGVPAFRIFSDQVLRAMAIQKPQSDAELLAISGVGLATVQKYGAQLYRMLLEA
jgi:superfamily II DNA helicase RecQ